MEDKLKEHKLIYNDANEMVDKKGRPYLCSSVKDIDGLLRNISRALEGKGLTLLLGDGEDDNYWVQVVNTDRPPETVSALHGVQHGLIKMEAFTESDYDSFAGAGEQACSGSFTFNSGGNPMWKMFDGDWTVIVDEYGVSLYYTSEHGDEIVMTRRGGDANVAAGLKFVADKILETMDPSYLLLIGFGVDVCNLQLIAQVTVTSNKVTAG